MIPLSTFRKNDCSAAILRQKAMGGSQNGAIGGSLAVLSSTSIGIQGERKLDPAQDEWSRRAISQWCDHGLGHHRIEAIALKMSCGLVYRRWKAYGPWVAAGRSLRTGQQAPGSFAGMCRPHLRLPLTTMPSVVSDGSGSLSRIELALPKSAVRTNSRSTLTGPKSSVRLNRIARAGHSTACRIITCCRAQLSTPSSFSLMALAEALTAVVASSGANANWIDLPAIILHVAAKLTPAGIHAPVTRYDSGTDMIFVGSRCPAYRGKSNWADDHILVSKDAVAIGKPELALIQAHS